MTLTPFAMLARTPASVIRRRSRARPARARGREEPTSPQPRSSRSPWAAPSGDGGVSARLPGRPAPAPRSRSRDRGGTASSPSIHARRGGNTTRRLRGMLIVQQECVVTCDALMPAYETSRGSRPAPSRSRASARPGIAVGGEDTTRTCKSRAPTPSRDCRRWTRPDRSSRAPS